MGAHQSFQPACAACHSVGVLTRRRLLGLSAGAVAAPLLLAATRNPILAALAEDIAEITPFKPCGPGAAYVPRVMAAAYYRETGTSRLRPERQLRRILGNNSAKRRKPRTLISRSRPAPLFTAEKARQWRQRAEGEARGLVVMRLDFTAGPMMEVETILLDLDLPMLFFVPNQRMFGWGTWSSRTAYAPGAAVRAGFQLRGQPAGEITWALACSCAEMRFVNVTGSTRDEARLPFWGSLVRRVPLSTWHEQFLQQKVKVNAEVKAIADYCCGRERVAGPTRRPFSTARSAAWRRNILQQEQADVHDGLRRATSVPPCRTASACLAFSRMMDDGVPAICEQDLTCGLCMALSQLLFGRPGFLHNLGWDTTCDNGGCFVSTHCTGPTRLRGTGEKPVPFELRFHHGQKDPMAMAIWAKGEEVTMIKATQDKPVMSIVTGSVVDMLDPDAAAPARRWSGGSRTASTTFSSTRISTAGITTCCCWAIGSGSFSTSVNCLRLLP